MATRLYIGDSGKQVPVIGVPVAKELGGLTIDNFIGAVDENGKLLAPMQITDVKWEGIKDVGDYAAWYLLQNNASLQTLDLSSLEHISGSYACSYMCYHCDNLREINLDNLSNKYYENTWFSNESLQKCIVDQLPEIKDTDFDSLINEVKTGKATVKSYDCIIKPLLSEETMKNMETMNKITVQVNKNSNKVEIKNVKGFINNVDMDAVIL